MPADLCGGGGAQIGLPPSDSHASAGAAARPGGRLPMSQHATRHSSSRGSAASDPGSVVSRLNDAWRGEKE